MSHYDVFVIKPDNRVYTVGKCLISKTPHPPEGWKKVKNVCIW